MKKTIFIIFYFFIYTLHSQVLTFYSPISGASGFNSIAMDAQGNKWLGGVGVYKFDGTNWTNYTTTNSGLINNNIITILIDPLNNIWFGTQNGVSKFNGSTWTNFSLANYGLRTTHVNAIAIEYKEDSVGSLWLGGDGFLINLTNTTCTNYSYIFPIDSTVHSLAFDKTHNLWVGTRQTGIYKYDGINWANKSLTSWIPTSSIMTDVTAIAIDADNNKWFGLLTHGAFKLVDTTWTYYSSFTSSVAVESIFQITTDKNGNVYFANGNGVGFSEYDGLNFHMYPFCTNTANCAYPQSGIAIDTLGNKWIASVYCGLVKMEDCTPSTPVGFYGPTTVTPWQNTLVYGIQPIPNATSYQWTLPSGFIGNSNTNNIIISTGANPQSGIISVRGNNNCGNGASVSMNVTALAGNGINEIKENIILTVYPNPTTNQTTINYPLLTNEGELQIYNTMGQLVYQEKLSKTSSQKEINTRNFKAGLYKIIVKEKGIIKGQVSLVK